MLAARRTTALRILAGVACILATATGEADPGSDTAADAPAVLAADTAPEGESEAATTVVRDVPFAAGAESLPAACGQTDICVPLRPAFTDLGPGGAESYAIFDAVFLQRDNQSAGRPLVVDGPGGPAALHSGGLSSATQPGFRLLYGRARGCDPGWEVGYLGVWGMFASDTATGANGTLQAAGPLGLQPGVLQAADFARSSYRSSVNSLEVNLFRRWSDGGPDRLAGEPWRRCGPYDEGTFDWLAGFRWAGLDETALLAFSPPGNRGAGLYGVEASSNIFAAQVGARSRMAWERWAFETWGKVAFGGSAMGQSQQPIYNSDIVVAGEPLLERSARSSREGGVGLIGDLTFALTYRINETWGLRLGYNLLWLSGVALAPNQFDFAAPPGGGQELHGGSGIYLYGASLGGEARW